MKLNKIINNINQQEISKFYNILTSIIDEIGESINLVKDTDPDHFVDTFNKTAINNKYLKLIANQIAHDPILDIVIDIIIRDGNCIISRDWFKILLEKEIKSLIIRIKRFKEILQSEDNKIDPLRYRDYNTYYKCVHTAFNNDLDRNASQTITSDEISILNTLKKSLELSNDESRAIFFLVVGINDLKNINVDTVIQKIKDSGIGFYKKTEMNVYIPEEFVYLLRKIKGIKIADKNTRRILKCLDNKQINKIKKKYGITVSDRHEKIEAIISQGIDIDTILRVEIFESEISTTEKKNILKDLIENKLEIHLERAGKTLDERLDILFDYFNSIEKDSTIGIPKDGYDRLLTDFFKFYKPFEKEIKTEFQIEKTLILNAEFLLEYNIKPRDILYLLPIEITKDYCSQNGISIRGKNIVNQILSEYRDSETVYLENYSLIAKHDINGLKNNGVEINSEEIGITFENVTKSILSKMNLNIDESLRKEINTKKEKADIILKVNDNELLIGECKASKNAYSSFSSIKRQIESYNKHYISTGFMVRGCFIVSGEFSDDFKEDCQTYTDLNLTLIEAETLESIYSEFKKLKRKDFPINLFRHGVMAEDTVIKALQK